MGEAMEAGADDAEVHGDVRQPSSKCCEALKESEKKPN